MRTKSGKISKSQFFSQKIRFFSFFFFSFFFRQKNAIFLVWLIEDITLQPELYSPSPFRIRGVGVPWVWHNSSSSSSRTVLPLHCCIVVHINVIKQQNIFFSQMNRPSDDSSRRKIPVRFWGLLHTFKQFFLNKKYENFFVVVIFTIFLNF